MVVPQQEKEAPTWQQIGIEMVTIPAGEFLYGIALKSVHLAEYRLARTPVTNTQYQAFIDATSYEPPRHWQNGRFQAGKEDHPVVYVSWYDALVFCQWAGCRLPTELEWEKGARGTDGREYPWGDAWTPGVCNTRELSIQDTTPVGRYPRGASPHGLLDMAGNVWEWCEGQGLFRVLRGGSWLDPRSRASSTFRRRDFPELRNYDYGFRCCLGAGD
jgi:formylglycine-generating enzyme required for sulfatase activity